MKSIEKLRLKKAQEAAQIRQSSNGLREKAITNEIAVLQKLIRRRRSGWSDEMHLDAIGSSMQIYVACYPHAKKEILYEFIQVYEKACTKYRTAST